MWKVLFIPVLLFFRQKSIPERLNSFLKVSELANNKSRIQYSAFPMPSCFHYIILPSYFLF